MANPEPLTPFFALSPTEQSGLLVIITLVGIVLTILTIASKLFIRGVHFPIKSYDYALLCGSILLFIQGGLTFHAAKLGVGNHQDTIGRENLDALRKTLYAVSLLGISVAFFTKLCMCFFIRSINTYSSIYTANYLLIGLITALFIANFLSTAFQCPLPPWLASSEETCPAITAIYTFAIVANATTDVLVVLLAIFMVARVQTDLKAKLLVNGLFSLRLLCPITAVPALLDTSHLYNDETKDFTWLALYPAVWLTISYNLSVITACIPSLKGLFNSWLGNTLRANVEAPYQGAEIGVRSGPDGSANIESTGSRKTMKSFRSKDKLIKGESIQLSSWTAAEAGLYRPAEARRRGPDAHGFRNGSFQDSEDGQSDSVKGLTRATTMTIEDIEMHMLDRDEPDNFSHISRG